MPSSIQTRQELSLFCYEVKEKVYSTAKSIIDRLIAWAKEFFIALGVIRPPAFRLEPRQSLFIQRYKLHPEHYRRAAHPQSALHELPVTPCAQPQSAPIGNKRHDDYLEDLKSFVHHFSQELSKCIFKVHGAKIQEISKKAPTDLPEKMRTIIHWIYELGDKKNKPLFKKISENKNMRTWSPDMDTFLKWVKSDGGEDIYIKLLTDLQTKIDPNDIPKGQQIDNYINLVLGTLLNSKTMTMSDLWQNHDLEPHILEKVLEAAMKSLFDHKINIIMGKVNAIIQNRLPEIIGDMLQVNMVKIADMLTLRIADLIQNIGEEQPNVGNPNYIKMVDAIMSKINEQAVAFLEAENATKSSTVDELFLQKFRESDICHDVIRGKLLPISAAQNISIEEYHKKLDNVIYGMITENFLELLFPSKEMYVDGHPQRISGTRGIIEHIELPPVFYELVADIKKIAYEITTPDTIHLVDKIIEPLKSLFEKFLLSNVQGLIFEGTRKAFSNLVKLLSDVDQLDAFVGERILPVLIHRLICTMAAETIRHQTTDFAPLLSNLILENNRAAAMDVLMISLYDKVKKATSQFDIVKEFPFEKFRQAVLYIIEDIETMLRVEKDASNRKQPLSPPEISALLKTYYTSTYKADNNPLYAHLVMNTVFRIGNFGKFTETLLGFSSLQTLISTAIVSSMKRVRTSPRQIITSIIKVAAKRFSKEENLLKILAARKTSIPELNQPALLAEKKKEMKIQMDKAARLVYDLAVSNIARSVAGGHLVAKGVLGKDATHLRSVMENCYRKFFGNAILAQNLLYQIQDVVVDTFRESARRVTLKEQTS